MLDIGIGRFPVRTAAEAKAAVDKTIAYMENKQAGPWKHTVCYVADDGDKNLHASQSELLASYTEKNYPSLLVNGSMPMLSIVNLPLPEKLILMLRNASCSYLTGECW